MSEYTKGPWKLHGGTIYAKAPEDSECTTEGALAVIVQANENSWDDLATGHLIAAAPELLEELEKALDTLEWLHSIEHHLNMDSDYEFEPDIARMKALIAKAKGES